MNNKEEAYQSFHIFFNNSPQAALLVDNGRFVNGNKSGLNFLRCKSLDDLHSISFENIMGRVNNDKKSIKPHGVKPDIFKKNYLHTRKNEKDCLCEFSLIKVYVSDCNTISYVIFNDFEVENKSKNQKKIEARVNHLASIGEVAAGIGHEINNLLLVISGNIELTQKEKCIGKENLNQRLDKMKDAGERIKLIVDGLREYSRINKQFDEIFNINNVLQKTINLISEVYLKEGVSIKLNIANEDFFIKGSICKMQQIVMNLLSNARDATSDILKREITLSLYREKSNIIVSVRDNGEGIPKQIKEKILDPYFTTKAVGVGTGIGLSLVNNFVNELGGKIEIETEINKGSEFKIYLRPSAAKEKIEPETKKQKNLPLAGKALVIDDDEDVRFILVEFLKDFGLDVVEASNGEEALGIVAQHNFDYICSDIQMPLMDGYEFLKKSMKITSSKVKYFLISGNVESDFSSLNSNVKIISKPFSQEEIYHAFTL